MFPKNVLAVTKGREGGDAGVECGGAADSSVVGRCSNHSHELSYCTLGQTTHTPPPGISDLYSIRRAETHTPAARSLIQNLVKSVLRPLSSLELLTDRVIEGDHLRCLATVQASTQFSSHPIRPMIRRETRVWKISGKTK